MKTLLLPVLLAALAAPALAAVADNPGDTKSLKERFKNQKPQGDPENAATQVGGAAVRPQDDFVDELEKLLLTLGWSKNAADNDKLSPASLKRHRILRRSDPVNGLEYTVLVPKEVVEGGQLVYKSILSNADGTARRPPMALQRVRGQGDMLVLEFDQQRQWLDLTKPNATNGFDLLGFAHKENGDWALRQFSSADAFTDALKSAYGADGEDASRTISERIKTVSGGRAFVVEAVKLDKKLLIFLSSGGKTFQLQPGK